MLGVRYLAKTGGFRQARLVVEYKINNGQNKTTCRLNDNEDKKIEMICIYSFTTLILNTKNKHSILIK